MNQLSNIKSLLGTAKPAQGASNDLVDQNLLAALRTQEKVGELNASGVSDLLLSKNTEGSFRSQLDKSLKKMPTHSKVLNEKSIPEDFSAKQLKEFSHNLSGINESLESNSKLLSKKNLNLINEKPQLVKKAFIQNELNNKAQENFTNLTQNMIKLNQSQAKGVKSFEQMNKQSKIIQNIAPQLMMDTKNAMTQKASLSKPFAKISQSLKAYKMDSSPIRKNTETMKSSSDLMSLSEMLQAQNLDSIESAGEAKPIVMQDLNLQPSISKQLNLDTIQVNTKNVDQLIEQISDYIIQSKVTGQKSLELSVQSQDLGQIDMMLKKQAGGDQISIQIQAHNTQTGKALIDQQGQLVNQLQSAGIVIEELKIDLGQSKLANDDFKGSDEQKFGQSKDFSSQEDQAKKDSERREQLWKHYAEELV